MIRRVQARDLDLIAVIESRLFQRPLDRNDLDLLQARPASRGFVYEDEQGRVVSYALFLNAGASADIISVGTDPAAQRQRLASQLLELAFQELGNEGVAEVILEVAVDNIAALALYRAAAFAEVARRKGYYRRPSGVVDAIVMRRNLASGSA